MPQEEIPKIYTPSDWEDRLYSQWEKSDFFNPDTCIEKGVSDVTAPTFSMVLPPPNVTGTLHTGSACMLAIEDLVTRYHRMKGDRTLWVPGTDHAAIATQSKVERIIFEKEGKTRHDLGRDELLRRIETFAKESHDTIIHQTKKLGASLDWSREAYTLDEKRARAVRTAFERMYNDGLIYQGDRIVNWDPRLGTTVSDDEIDWKEETAPLYSLQYGPFVITTARPETKFGDKYVVMHPNDERYAKYTHGEKIEVEWIHGPITATIIKDEAIDQTFGTGVMTITPWHDHTDFEIAERHHLDKEQIIDEKGNLLPIAGEFAGLPITEARTKIIEKLRAKNLVVGVDEKYIHRIATNSRGGGIIEPQIKKQWFIAVNKEFLRDGKPTTLKSLMRAAVAEKNISILPDRFERTYSHWIENLRDWCISRQIWYGHRIPVWYCLSCGEKRVNPTVKSRWHFVRHGETDLNQEEIVSGSSETSLNETGRKQAREAAEKLASQHIDVIFSSHQSRAQETAHIIADRLGIGEVIIDDRLRERHMGEADGIPYREAREKYPDIYQYEGKSANNENFRETEERMWEAVSEHLAKHAHKNVVIVSHGAALRALLRRIRNVAPEELFTGIKKVPNATPLSVDILDPCEHCGGHFSEQDSDTLDTWFSSGLWTFSTLGWPDSAATATAGKPGPENDFANYHPTTLLETGYDILPFWVARMILMSTCLLGEVPFRTVYLHGLVRDEEGRKMSKSLDNIIDPLDVIKEHGADALRLALVIGSTPGNDLKLGDEKIKSFRNFTNKLWNIGRYVQTQANIDGKLDARSAADHWILSRLRETATEVTRLIENYQLSLAGEKLRDFTWNEFADWYVEIHKIEKNDGVLRFVFDTLLVLWHPFMPFVTEALSETLGHKQSLLIQKWPTPENIVVEKDDAQRFELVLGLITALRSLRTMYHIEPAKKLTVAAEGSDARILEENKDVFLRLARVENIVDPHALSTTGARIQSGLLNAFVELEGVIDLEAEKQRIEKEKSEKERYIASLTTKLENKNFVERAKPEIVEGERAKLAEAEKELASIEAHLATLSTSP